MINKNLITDINECNKFEVVEYDRAGRMDRHSGSVWYIVK